MTYPLAVHCAECAARLEIERPTGRIVFNTDERIYHLAPDDGDYQDDTTVCGLAQGDLDSVIGAHGTELSAYELCHRMLRGRSACSECFANVW